jgi:SAM-dependent methyltransferase
MSLPFVLHKKMKKYFQKSFSDNRNIEYWDRVYDQQDFSGYVYRKRRDMVLAWLDSLSLSEKSIILEAGCGGGRFAYEAVKRGYRVFGMDYSHGMVMKARRICNREDKYRVAFLQGDIEALPLKTASFDVIVCLGVVAYLKSEGKALRELARAIKPGGVLAISIVNKVRLAYRLDFPLLLVSIFKRILNGRVAFWKRSFRVDNAPPLTTYFIPKFQRSLELAGFTILESRTVPLRLLTFFGRQVLPHKMTVKITQFFERFSNVPFLGSFGGMCIFKAERNHLTKWNPAIDTTCNGQHHRNNLE